MRYSALLRFSAVVLCFSGLKLDGNMGCVQDVSDLGGIDIFQLLLCTALFWFISFPDGSLWIWTMRLSRRRGGPNISLSCRILSLSMFGTSSSLIFLIFILLTVR